MDDKFGENKVGLALGGGSARGWAHIGVLKALDEAGIKINYISGTSIGALVGAVYAVDGIKKLESFAKKITWKTIVSYVDPVLPRTGMISGKRINKLLEEYFGDKEIEDLEIPFTAISVDIQTGNEIKISSGRIVDAVRASISIPGIFTPFVLNKRFLVDGGIVNPLPVDSVMEMGADIIIAVNLNRYVTGRNNRKNLIVKEKGVKEKNFKDQKKEKKNIQMFDRIEDKYFDLLDTFRRKKEIEKSATGSPNIFEIIDSTIHIMENRITDINLKEVKPDFLIEPEVGDLRLFDFDRASEAIEEGYKKTASIIPELKNKINN
ncbi:MAG: patatin-like phospholipase family protein [Acidobacteriota bacterium]